MLPNLKSLLEPEKLALTRARLHAWWEGEEFNEEEARAALAAKAKPVDGAGDALGSIGAIADEPLEPAEPRIQALEVLWGHDRVTPGEALDEKLHATRTGLPATGTLCVLGPGLSAPLAAMAEAHPGPFKVFEWRDEALAALGGRVKRAGLGDRCEIVKLDFDLFFAPAGVWDGVVSLDEFTYAPSPSRLAVQIAKGLKPGCVAVLETYVADVRIGASSAFATAFSEPHIIPVADLRETLKGAGLTLEDDEDLTSAHIELAKAGFRRLEEALSTVAQGGMGAGVAREIAWEAESWGKRLALLSSGKLQRRRLIARRPD